MNSSQATVNLSILSEPIHPIDESDYVSLDPQILSDRAIERIIIDQEEVKNQADHHTAPIVWNDWDIPIGRSRNVREFVGNARYRDLVEQYRPSYLAVKKRKEKRDISATIYNIIKSNGGRFLAPCGSRSESWYEISKEKALAKIGQALRIGVRPPQQMHSSSWTYPFDDHRESVPNPPRPLFVNLPHSASEGYNSSGPTDVMDNISNLSFTSDDQLAVPSLMFTASQDLDGNASTSNHEVQRYSTASLDPYLF